MERINLNSPEREQLEYTKALRHYEQVHAEWMNTPKHTKAGKDVAKRLKEARDKLNFEAEHRIRRPVWACDQYGNYGHDWMDCPNCVREYERHTNETYPVSA